MPYKLSNEIPIRETKNSYIYPASIELLERHFPIDHPILNSYINLRDSILNNYNINKIYDSRLRIYQNLGIQFINRLNRVGIFDQQRLGKTPTTLVSLPYKDIKESILIIAPKSTLLNWEQECKTWLPEQVSVCRIDPSIHPKPKRIELYNNHSKVYIMGYQTASNDNQFLPSFDCIIIDEAHRLRNFKGARSKNSPTFTKNIIKIAHQCKYRYLLSGTPSPNYAYNIYPILHTLYPETFSSYYNFIDYYFEKEVVYTKTGTTEKPTKFKIGKEKELRQLLQVIAIQRKRKNYMQWLPPIDKKHIYLNMDKQFELWYNELQQTYEIKEKNIICENQLTLLTALRKLTTEAKTQWILDYIEDYPDEQIIIASVFTSFLTSLFKLIPNSKLCIGKTSDKQRKSIQDEFNAKKFNIMLANIDVIKEGMKLEQGNTIIIVDPSLTYTDNEQLEDRIVPTAPEIAEAKEKQQVLYLIMSNTVDEYIKEQLALKKTSTDIINNFNRKEKSNGN